MPKRIRSVFGPLSLLNGEITLFEWKFELTGNHFKSTKNKIWTRMDHRSLIIPQVV